MYLEPAAYDAWRRAAAYFDFAGGGPGSTARPLPPARCERCHAAHAARDHVFLQFYPLLRDRRAAPHR